MVVVGADCYIRSRIPFLLSGQGDGDTSLYSSSKKYNYLPVLKLKTLVL